MSEFNPVFLSRMKDILKNEYPDFLSALDRPNEKAIFVNQNKITLEKFKEIVDFDISPISYERCGFYVDGEKRGRHPLHHAGAFYLQEPSAMFTINCVDLKGDELVMDMCSAPGGKSIQIANRLNKGGVLISNEFNKARSGILYSNIERMGLRNVIITNNSTETLAKAYSGLVDVCFVDAPCSGEGMFRKGDKMVESWNENLNLFNQARQLEILENANAVLKTGGKLVYSTCTYSLEENEQVIRKFMDKHNYELLNIPFDLPRGVDMPEAVRLYPHVVKGEGQFVALLKKKEESSAYLTKNLALKKNKEAEKLLKQVLTEAHEVFEYENYCYVVPDENLIKSCVNYVSLGVRVAEIKKDRVEPYHYLFTAFGDKFKIKFESDFMSLDTQKYLKGETISLDLEDGFGAFLVNGCALGGFKIAKSRFKNYYPKGLRNF